MSKKSFIPPPSYYHPLFSHMAMEHGLTLLESELEDIIQVVSKMMSAKAERNTAQLKLDAEIAATRQTIRSDHPALIKSP